MDITASNFRATLPLVFDAISAADFVAMDGEFSGLRRDTDDQAFSIMDTLEERYTKVAASVKEFGLLQLGLSCFHFDASKRQYDTATFSFYLLKKKTAIYSPNTFTVCSNSLRFLASNKFDFNKLFSDGLPYLNRDEALKKRSCLPDRIVERLGVCTDKPTVQDAFSVLYKVIKKNVTTETQALPSRPDVLDSSGGGREDSVWGESNGTSGGFVVGDDFKPSDLLDVPVAQLRSPAGYAPPKHSIKKFSLKDIKRSFWKALRVFVINEYPNADATIDYENSSIVIRIFLNQKDRNKFVYYDEINNFYDAVGFSHIAVHLLESGKPLVGHNCILDVMHFADKCLEPLPLSLGSFKHFYKANFPLLYDTKLLVFDAPFGCQLDNTMLKSVYEFASSSCPKLVVRRDCKSYNLKTRDKVKEHDAGYDAFMTGVAFLGLVRKLDGPRNRDKIVVKSPHLKKIANRTYVMQICDMHALHLAGDDEVVDRSGIFVVTSSSELRFNLVKTFFPDLASPNILSDFSANNRHFVLPSTDADRNRAPTLLRKAQTLCPSGVNICMYIPKANTSESMETAEFSSTTAAALNVSLKSKNIPPPLPSDSSLTGMSVEGTNEIEQESDPLTPRTAQLARNSTLSAKSPEFTPASTADRCKKSSRNLNVSQQTPPAFCSEEASETDKEDLGVVIPHDQVDDEKRSSVSASVFPKRGEKRKSGQQCEEVQMTEVEEESSLADNSEDGSTDWQTVRNRNRFQNWRGGSSSYNTANRFMLGKGTDSREGLDGNEEHSSRRRGKRSRVGDVRSPSRNSGELTDEVNPHGIADHNDEGGVRGPGTGVLKRLKSVGTEQFSSLSLESPTGDRVFGAPSETVGCTGGDAGGSPDGIGAVLPAAHCHVSDPAQSTHQEDLEEILQQHVSRQKRGSGSNGKRPSAAGKKKRASHDEGDNDECFQVPNDW
ncbi:Ribonuclease CAF1 [Trinorchestia longiramus]|nr:Ribonuclease CAF1 [Trinorchestia longiramus]